jgi:hypothetical protein
MEVSDDKSIATIVAINFYLLALPLTRLHFPAAARHAARRIRHLRGSTVLVLARNRPFLIRFESFCAAMLCVLAWLIGG